MDQIAVYGFCILAALILAAMLFRFRVMTKAWERQKKELENSMQEMKEFHDILLIDLKCLFQEQEEAVTRLQNTFSHMTGASENICCQKDKAVQAGFDQEERLSDIKNEIQTLKDEAEKLEETVKNVLLETEKLKDCSRSANDAYMEFMEKNRSRKEAAEQVQKQVNDIRTLAEGLKEQVQWADQLAEQIELLSLNTNIEAAKNESQENGFSVIALEMRKLSDECREFANAFVRKNQEIFMCAEQTKDDIDYMIKLQDTEQTRITKTGFLLEQFSREIRNIIQAQGDVSDDMEGFETTEEKIRELLEHLPSVKNQIQEGITPEELQDLLAKAGEDSQNLVKLTEEMRSRIAE